MIDFDSLMTWVNLTLNLLTLEKEPWQLGALPRVNSTAWHSTISRDDEQFSCDHVTFYNATCDAFIMSGSRIGLSWRPFRFNRWTSSPAAIHNLQDSHLQWRGYLQTQRRPQKYLDESSPMTVVVLRTPENVPEHSLGVIEVYLKWFLHVNNNFLVIKKGLFLRIHKTSLKCQVQNWLGTGRKWVKR